MSKWRQVEVELREKDGRTIDALRRGDRLLVDKAEGVERDEMLSLDGAPYRVMETGVVTHDGRDYARLTVRPSNIGGAFDGGELP